MQKHPSTFIARGMLFMEIHWKGVSYMTHRIVKSFSITLIILLLISIVGCGSNASSKKEDVSHQSKTTEVTKDQNEQTAANKTKVQDKAAASANNQTKTNPDGQASTETASKQADKQSSTAKQNQTNTATRSATHTAAKTAANTSSASKPAAAASTGQSSLKTVKITIIGPKDKGTLLSGKSVKINAGDTVLDVLLKAAGTNNVDYSGGGASAYVRGIDNIYEFDYGQTSGWTYTQNGVMIQKSCGAVKVTAGDRIKWIYKEN